VNSAMLIQQNSQQQMAAQKQNMLFVKKNA
jgi:hypothetical protein